MIPSILHTCILATVSIEEADIFCKEESDYKVIHNKYYRVVFPAGFDRKTEKAVIVTLNQNQVTLVHKDFEKRFNDYITTKNKSC